MRVKSDNQSVTMPNHYRGSGRFCAGAGQPGMIRACPARFGYPKNDSQPQRSHSGGAKSLVAIATNMQWGEEQNRPLFRASLKNESRPSARAPLPRSASTARQKQEILNFEIAERFNARIWIFFLACPPFFSKSKALLCSFPESFYLGSQR